VDGIDPDRVLTIHNGLDLADWMSDVHAPNKSSEVKITTVGNIRRVKGHDILIRAAAIILREYPDVSFSIAGDVLEQDYFAELLNLIQALNLSHRVYFAGGVRDLREHLSASDIFVLPSRSEGFSNAIVEAMATALPIVATDVGGNAEAVIDGVTGFLIPPENPEALAEAIMRLLRDPTRSKRMGLAGQGIVAQRFTTDAMMNQIKATYDRLLSEADS
jgi:glycosyltransferase involved in cell wall biosynthesis